MTKQDKSIKVIYQTPAFRISYPTLFEPKADLNGKMKFSLQMLFPKTVLAKQLKAAKGPASTLISEDNLKGLYQECVKVAKQTFGPEVDISQLKMPNFRDGDKPKLNGKVEENAKGMIVLNASTNERPKVLRTDKTQIEDKDEVYPGCWCRAVLCIASFNMPGAKGVTMYVNGVQKLADDQTFSGRARVEDVFDDTAAELGAGPTDNFLGVGVEAPKAEPKNPWED